MVDPEGRDPGVPPADPESWTDDEWISWLEATDAVESDDRPSAPRRWARRAPSSALGAVMLGLHEVIYGKKNKVEIVADAPGDPPRDDVPDVELDAEHTAAIVRHRVSTPRNGPSSPGAAAP